MSADGAAPVAEGAGAEGAAEGAAADGEGGESNFTFYTSMFRVLLFYMASQMLFGRLFQAGGKPSGAQSGGQSQSAGAVMGEGRPMKLRHSNAWSPRQPFELRVYVSEEPSFVDFDDSSKLVWHEPTLAYAAERNRESVLNSFFGWKRNGSTTYARNVTIHPSSSVRSNASQLWAHVYVSALDTAPDTAGEEAEEAGKVDLSRPFEPTPLRTSEAHHPLIKLIHRPMSKPLKNLITGEYNDEFELQKKEAVRSAGSEGVEDGLENGDEGAEQGGEHGDQLVPHWKGTLPIELIEDFSSYPPRGIPLQVRFWDVFPCVPYARPHFPLISPDALSSRDSHARNRSCDLCTSLAHTHTLRIPPQVRESLSIDEESGKYTPPLWIGELWSLEQQMAAVNQSTAELRLEMSFGATSLLR